MTEHLNGRGYFAHAWQLNMRPFQDLAISFSSESSDGETANFILGQFTAINTTEPPTKPRATRLVPCVEIPKKSFIKDDYPYLPGYSTVDHIRSKAESLTSDSYEVVLKSGDIRVVSAVSNALSPNYRAII